MFSCHQHAVTQQYGAHRGPAVSRVAHPHAVHRGLHRPDRVVLVRAGEVNGRGVLRTRRQTELVACILNLNKINVNASMIEILSDIKVTSA